MSTMDVALDHYRSRQRLVAALRGEAARLWRQIDQSDINGSWRRLMPRLLLLLTAAQQAAAGQADGYLAEILAVQGINPDSSGSVEPAALAGVASDGRPLVTLLDQPRITTMEALGQGATVARALSTGFAALDMIVSTQVADAGRVADQVALTARRHVAGYVRMLNGKSCSRCVVLAGRWYRYNASFDRHPRCDCIGVPASEDHAGDLRTDPRAYFDSLSTREQDRVFTVAGARAIRDGADLGQVVNARRGALGLAPAGVRITAAEAEALRGDLARGRLQAQNLFGRDLFVTTEGATTRGLAGVRLGARQDGVKDPGVRNRQARTPRLMPESIYQIAAGDRDEAIRLLRRFGFIL